MFYRKSRTLGIFGIVAFIAAFIIDTMSPNTTITTTSIFCSKYYSIVTDNLTNSRNNNMEINIDKS